MVLNIHFVQEKKHQNCYNSSEYAIRTSNNLNHCMVLNKEHIENRVDGTYKNNDCNCPPYLLASQSWLIFTDI